MLPIKKIVIPCYWKDVWLARICVASIRYWYPDIQICLISSCQFGTADFESYWNVAVQEYPHQPLGMYTKLYSLIEPQRERILLLDADTILIGPILQKLEECEEDFVVNWHRGNVPLPQSEREAHAAAKLQQHAWSEICVTDGFRELLKGEGEGEEVRLRGEIELPGKGWRLRLSASARRKMRLRGTSSESPSL